MQILRTHDRHTVNFDLPHLAAFGREDFLVAPSNEEAVALIDTSHEWGRPIKALIGPEASGKSHLAAVFSLQTGAQIFLSQRLKRPPCLS